MKHALIAAFVLALVPSLALADGRSSWGISIGISSGGCSSWYISGAYGYSGYRHHGWYSPPPRVYVPVYRPCPPPVVVVPPPVYVPAPVYVPPPVYYYRPPPVYYYSVGGYYCR